jgi:hypothetical protein
MIPFSAREGAPARRGGGGVGGVRSCTSYVDHVTLMLFRGWWGGMLVFMYMLR